ncbi:hypothetical protein ACC782_33730 [Rhizobium ruizarguesonis]
MLVKVNTSLAGADFSFRFGEEVEQDVFSALVGNGWDSLCEPVVETAVEADPAETAVVPAPEEAAVVYPVVETADAAPARRGRRK